jgi:hypothetical protein
MLRQIPMRSLPIAVALALAIPAGCDRPEPSDVSVSSVPPPPAPPPAPTRSPVAVPAQKPSFEQMVQQSQPLSPAPEAQQLGARRISAERCTLEGPPFLGKSPMDVFKAIEVAGSRILIVDQLGRMHGFLPQRGGGCVLAPDPAFGEAGMLKLPHKIESLSRDGAGRVMASNGIFGAWGVDQGKQGFACDTKGHVELHRSGKWGIAPFVNATVRMVEIADGECKSEDWVLQNLSDDKTRQGPFANVNSSAIVGDLVLIGGVLAKSENEKQPRVVIGYSRAGKEKFRFGSVDSGTDDALAWVHAVQGCTAGICVVDSNLRRLSLWTRAGKHVGSVKLDALLGLSSPWIPDFSVAKDGSAWLVTAAERGKSGVSEGLLYRVRGL